MKSTRHTAAISVAMLAGLLFLWVLYTDHAAAPTSLLPTVDHQMTVPAGPEIRPAPKPETIARAQLIDSPAPSRKRPLPAIDTEATVTAPTWHLILYPELARIAELENESTDNALVELLPMLSSNDPVVRLAALESIADMSHPARLSVLSAALDDPEPQIRVLALEALAIEADEQAVHSILPYVYDSETEVRIAAIEALAVIENEITVHTLAGLLSDQDLLVRRHAVNALGEIGGENARSYLLQARYDPDETIRANADAMLAEMTGGRSF